MEQLPGDASCLCISRTFEPWSIKFIPCLPRACLVSCAARPTVYACPAPEYLCGRADIPRDLQVIPSQGVEPPATCAPRTSKKPSVVRDARRTSRITDSPVDMHLIHMHMVRKKSPARRTIEHSRSSVSPVLPRLGAGAFSLIRALEPSHKHPAVPTTAQDAGREWTAGLLSDRAASASRLPDIRFEVSTRFRLARTLSWFRRSPRVRASASVLPVPPPSTSAVV